MAKKRQVKFRLIKSQNFNFSKLFKLKHATLSIVNNNYKVSSNIAIEIHYLTTGTLS